jgi:RND family efflux transporter MFP subunit
MLSLLLRTLPIVLAAIVGGMVANWLANRPQLATQTGLYAPAPTLLGLAVPLVEAAPMPSASRYKLGGRIEPRDVVRLTAQQAGRVTFLAGQEGDRMAGGAVVVALDDDALRPEYRSAWAALSGDMAAQQNAQTQLYQQLYGQRQPTMGGPGYDAYERMATPFYNMFQSFMRGAPGGGPGSGAPMMTQAQAQRSPSAANNARADYERQQAALVGAQARLDALDQRLRDRRSIAPYASVIMARYVRVGDEVQAGQPLADLADPDQLDLRIEAPADLALNLKVGDQLPVSLDHSNLWATVSQIFPGADPVRHTVTIKAALPSGTAAAPGMFGLAWISQPGGGGQSATAPGIPRSAIVYRGSLPAAFVANPQGEAEMRILRLGEASDDRVAILSGLQIGDKVVANPAPDLKSGDSLFRTR